MSTPDFRRSKIARALHLGRRKRERRDEYPFQAGDVTVLGPEIFAAEDESVICWRGENYLRQPRPIRSKADDA